MKNKKIPEALKFAFPKTIPIFTGFMFLGFSYGLYMNVSGFSFVYPMIMSVTIFGGSLEFVAVTMLLSAFAPLQALIMTLMIQARHLFYGISMLEKYKGMGWKKPYLIFGMCDESFSINYSTDVPEAIDKGWFMFFVTLLNQIYWFIGSTIGGIAGSFLKFNTQGIEFVMTAMFVVIFLDQWQKEKQHISSAVGVFVSLACLLIFGRAAFMLPTMACIIFFLTVFRKPISRKEEMK